MYGENKASVAHFPCLFGVRKPLMQLNPEKMMPTETRNKLIR